jgi:hypothetical protein
MYTNHGSLEIWQTYGPPRAVTEIDSPFFTDQRPIITEEKQNKGRFQITIFPVSPNSVAPITTNIQLESMQNAVF